MVVRPWSELANAALSLARLCSSVVLSEGSVVLSEERVSAAAGSHTEKKRSVFFPSTPPFLCTLSALSASKFKISQL